MADSPDPATAVRTMLDQWLTLSAAVAEKTLAPGIGTPAPVDVATRADIEALGERLGRIEALLVALAGATLNRPAGGAEAAPPAFVPAAQ
ncbi:hypothetical protein KZX46_20360 [Polymorphobacter sp. PAMC 29334]|uniref:hypothetical protein n=1 Tax=Polymorphobacter sp. PAMC 29334 TaxID=2862331 RepID=UPI001C77268F|nr:hypothetical protein [Polymorphobacter sp. PAMC 29334]QYE35043.1 hypothetical protein KZX46_20360 [Polymorphobacter sp. PAMC 29334]